MSELGNRLRTAREAQGKSIGDLAQQLLVRKNIIEALEENRFSDLPEATLTRGYIRRYAQALGLDPEPLLAHYPKVAVADSPASRNLAAASKKTTSTVELPPKSKRATSAWPIILALLVLVGGALAWYGNREGWFSALNPSTQSAPPPIAVEPPPAVVEPPAVTQPVAQPTPVAPKKVRLQLSTTPATARIYLDGYQLKNPVNDLFEAGERQLRIEASGFQTYSETLRLVDDYARVIALQAASATPSTLDPSQMPEQAQPEQAQPEQAQPEQAQPASAQTGLVVKLEGSSWIQVISRGRVVYTGIPKAGTQLSYPLPASVRSGNAGAVRVLVNGKDQGLMGQVGQVATRRYAAPPAPRPTPPAP
jgi:cytoskeleton protein RodZ